jgi:flagellar biosynthesis protein FliQ
VRALCDSFTRAPIGTIGLPQGLGQALLRLFADMFTAGLTFAAPVLVVMLLVSLLIGLLARAVPQINVLEVGFTLRIVVALVAMLGFAPLLAPGDGAHVHGARQWAGHRAGARGGLSDGRQRRRRPTHRSKPLHGAAWRRARRDRCPSRSS